MKKTKKTKRRVVYEEESKVADIVTDKKGNIIGFKNWRRLSQ